MDITYFKEFVILAETKNFWAALPIWSMIRIRKPNRQGSILPGQSGGRTAQQAPACLRKAPEADTAKG